MNRSSTTTTDDPADESKFLSSNKKVIAANSSFILWNKMAKSMKEKLACGRVYLRAICPKILGCTCLWHILTVIATTINTETPI
jgi:hypothetical protein